MHRQMRYYIAVVETGSFFEAGEVCHISQSAISQQIRTLEKKLDRIPVHGHRGHVEFDGSKMSDWGKKK